MIHNSGKSKIKSNQHLLLDIKWEKFSQKIQRGMYPLKYKKYNNFSVNPLLSCIHPNIYLVESFFRQKKKILKNKYLQMKILFLIEQNRKK